MEGKKAVCGWYKIVRHFTSLYMQCASHRVPHNSDCAQTRKNKQNTFLYNLQKLHNSNQF